MKIPSVTRDQMIEIDRMMIEEYHIDLMIMMENAGRMLANQAKKMLNYNFIDKKIVILAGKGNNGGGGLVAARHLHNWGANINITINSPEKIKNIPIKQLDIDRRIGIEITDETDFSNYDLIIDALIGYNIRGDPKEPLATTINRANNSGSPILSLDIPSGLDSTSGKPYHPCIDAAATLTLALPKTGIMKKQAKSFVGKLYLADISIPREIYRKFGLDEDIFKVDSIIPLTYDEINS